MHHSPAAIPVAEHHSWPRLPSTALGMLPEGQHAQPGTSHTGWAREPLRMTHSQSSRCHLAFLRPKDRLLGWCRQVPWAGPWGHPGGAVSLGRWWQRPALPAGRGSAHRKGKGATYSTANDSSAAPWLGLGLSHWRMNRVQPPEMEAWRFFHDRGRQRPQAVFYFTNAEVQSLRQIPCLYFLGVLLLRCEHFLFYYTCMSVLSKPLH